MRNAIPAAAPSILTLFGLSTTGTFYSQHVRNSVPYIANWILTSLWPLWTFRKCVIPFHGLLNQYWPRSTTLNTQLVADLYSQFVRNAIPYAASLILTSFRTLWTFSMCVMPFPELLIRYWPCFKNFELFRWCIMLCHWFLIQDWHCFD